MARGQTSLPTCILWLREPITWVWAVEVRIENIDHKGGRKKEDQTGKGGEWDVGTVKGSGGESWKKGGEGEFDDTRSIMDPWIEEVSGMVEDVIAG